MNRKAYDDAMQRAYARWQRFQDNLVIVVADIDKFKHINDTFGHQAGDKVLEKVGYILGISFREYDIVARYGGEEFVTVMDKVTLENAHKVVERVRQTIEKCNFHYSNKPVPVTISFGIAKFRQGDDIETVFKRADDALYKAKNAGRNQVKIG